VSVSKALWRTAIMGSEARIRRSAPLDRTPGYSLATVPGTFPANRATLSETVCIAPALRAGGGNQAMSPKKTIPLTTSTRNVFSDLRVEGAEEALAKAELARRLA